MFLKISNSVSTVITFTLFNLACSKCETGLQILANIIRSGSTPKSKISLISFLEAQSKYEPKSANVFKINVSLLHLTA